MTPYSSLMNSSGADILKTVVTGIITLFVLAVMAYGVLNGADIGVFEPMGTLVIGYWFGAGAQRAVAQAGKNADHVPSVL